MFLPLVFLSLISAVRSLTVIINLKMGLTVMRVFLIVIAYLFTFLKLLFYLLIKFLTAWQFSFILCGSSWRPWKRISLGLKKFHDMKWEVFLSGFLQRRWCFSFFSQTPSNISYRSSLITLSPFSLFYLELHIFSYIKKSGQSSIQIAVFMKIMWNDPVLGSAGIRY